VERGFTLIEAIISLSLLLVILILSMAMLFTMRNFSQRQEMFASPRQTARRAIDYLTYYVAGASDMCQNNTPTLNNPNALVMFTGASPNQIQRSFDNVTNGAYAEPGTDILSLALPTGTGFDAVYAATGTDPYSGGDIAFTGGCGGTANDDAGNMALFKRLTGADSTGKSSLLLLAGGGTSATWAYLRITGYGTSSCTGGGITGVSVASQANTPVAPSSTIVSPYRLKAGVLFDSFRVKGGRLEQKTGIFDPASPDSGFTSLIDNVEDLQVAYIYTNGSVWNTASQTLSTTGSVPPQDYNPAATSTDVANVIGLRVTVVARSAQLPPTILSRARYNRPAAENRAAGSQDRFYHYRMTATVMLRNRMLGG
jgi:hypothetical protein